MKIALINSVAKGSTGGIAIELCHMLTNNNIENMFFFGIGECSDKNVNSYKFNTKFEVKFSILLTRLFGRHSFYSKLATLRLVKKLNEFKPDIVHLHNMHGHYINIDILFNYLKKNKIKTIWSFHDCWPMTGHCAHFDNIRCEKWQTGCNHCAQLDKYPISLHDASKSNWERKKKLVENWNDLTIITSSEWQKKLLEKSFFKNANIQCFYNGVDRNVFKPTPDYDLRKKYDIQDKFVIFSVYKGDISKAEIYVNLANMLSDDEVLLITAVDDNLKQLLPKSVITFPYMDRETLAKHYSMADVYLNITVEEAFCLVVAEAISCGTPVISCDRTAIPEVVGDCGVILDDFNAENIHSAIQTVKSNHYDCEKRAEVLFNKEKTYLQYLKLYKNI